MDFEVLEHSAFTPSSIGLFKPPYYSLGGRGNMSCFQNPTKTELAAGIYKPRLTLTKRKSQTGYGVALRIEFSAPKLVFSNNFDEVQEADFESVLDILHTKLVGMGISVRKDVLRNAPVSSIHYSKNMALTDYTTCSMITGELANSNLSKRLDLSKTDYRNEGHIIRFHANSYEITFYDKLKDMQQAGISEKRAIEQDNVIQSDLFKKASYPKQLEVLRMEVRLGNRTKIKAMLASLGIKSGMTFQVLFNANVSKKILLHFWQKATQDMELLALSQFKPEDIVHVMIAEGKGTKAAKMMQQLGWITLVRSIGIRGAKAVLGRQCSPAFFRRMKKDMDGLDITTNMKYAAMRHVQRCLEAFEPLKLKAFQAG
jgi:hypothetical protein